jgi:uncharacterized protein (DUF2062 family)
MTPDDLCMFLWGCLAGTVVTLLVITFWRFHVADSNERKRKAETREGRND